MVFPFPLKENQFTTFYLLLGFVLSSWELKKRRVLWNGSELVLQHMPYVLKKPNTVFELRHHT